MLEQFSVIEPQSFDSMTEEEMSGNLNSLAEKYKSDLDKLKRTRWPGVLTERLLQEHEIPVILQENSNETY